MACQTSAQRHGRDGYEGSAEPNHEQQQAPVPSCSHRGRPTGQPEEHQDAERTQLQGWRKGLPPVHKHRLHSHPHPLFSSMFTQSLQEPQRQIYELCIKILHDWKDTIDFFGMSFFIDCHTKGIWDGVGQVRTLQ